MNYKLIEIAIKGDTSKITFKFIKKQSLKKKKNCFEARKHTFTLRQKVLRTEVICAVVIDNSSNFCFINLVSLIVYVFVCLFSFLHLSQQTFYL